MALYIRHIISHIGTATHPLRRTLALLLLMVTLGAGAVWAQTPKVADGIYYIRNDATNQGYLWPSLTTNTTSGYQYLTTSLATTAEAVTNNNGVTYSAHDKSYSHWVVKNVTGGYIQLINPRLNKYVVIRAFPKANNTKQNAYGDRDVWLTDEPAEDIDYTYFVLNNADSPYKISPKPGLNNVANTSGYSLNSASGDDRVWLTWSKSDNKPQNGEGREGLLQLYSGGTPLWSFTSDSLDAPTIGDVSTLTGKVSVTDNNGLPSGYNIRYTIDGTDPTATSSIMASDGYEVTTSFTLKAVVERYGVVLTAVATKALSPAPCATPVISFDHNTSKVSIVCATPGTTIYYTTDGSTPSASSTEYSGPFSVAGTTTVKAIATHPNLASSQIATLEITQVATPTIQNNGSNAISITSATPGATIYYTINGTNPTTSSSEYTTPLQENVSGVTIKAIAVKENMITSAVGSGSVTLQCAAPVIARTSNNSFTITCALPSTGVTIYYTTNGNEPTTSSSSTTSGSSISCSLPITVKAFAVATNYTNSPVSTQTLTEGMGGSGTAVDPYTIEYQSDVADFIEKANTAAEASKHYKVIATGTLDFSNAAAITQSFSGTFDGGNCILSGLTHPLFDTVDGGTVKNVMLDNVVISQGTNVGAICYEALGASRIYNCGILATDSEFETNKDGYTIITNCSSTLSGSNYVGGLVGLLDGGSRVINCFSYANITGGSYVGGIVGYNNVTTTSTNLETMVMNCMFYGDITGGSSKAPIYNGQIITNRSDANGVSNFNYFWAGASYVQDKHIDVYNCALAAETRFLQRFEFFRPLLNSNRALAAWWATDNYNNKDEMMKWVMEPSQIGTATPYPILKAPDRYPSVVNIDVNHSETYKQRDLTIGPKLSTLTVNIQMGSGGNGDTHPNGAEILNAKRQLTLNVIDKDPAHFNFNYYKVQLPYYNDVGTKNYTENKVVTGWKIVSVDGSGYGTHTFSTGNMPADATATVIDGEITLTTPYNYADRKSTQKDVYSTNGGRIFNQGAYFDVPEGVTSITIEPYWAKCVYVSDEYPDVVYNQDMSTPSNVTTVGGGSRYTNGTAYSINESSQIVYNTMDNAVTALSPSGTVYDNAIVLVGNVHNIGISSGDRTKPYTIMSIDLDTDNEPDYSYILRFNNRLKVHPVRIDFLSVIGLGMAQKSTGGTGTYNFGIMQPNNWFECTNTGLFRVTQLEYDQANTTAGTGRSESPIILHGGVIEQWVAVGQSEQTAKEAKAVNYYHVGGNVWFKEFHIGAHQDKTQDEFFTPHPPISVSGGDYDIFYLTGYYNTPANNAEDNAECYINGGRFGKVAGTGMQGIGKTGGADNTGNIIWQIDNADIDEFYAGGINAAHIAQGNIYTVITNSRVDQFCGGPKFGDMNSDKVVVTNATNCTFRAFFGAGYGGNSYNRRYPKNKNNVKSDNDVKWNNWVQSEYKNNYSSDYYGVETRIDYQYIPMSNNIESVARLFVDYVSFSLATTYDVTSKLTNCTITTSKLGRLDLFEQCLGNFYGGGSLGKVAGPVKSTLINCTVQGNVFGAGYSATLPKVKVMGNQFQTPPHYDPNLGAYMDAEMPSSEQYDWEHAETVNSTGNAINTSSHKLYTTVDLNKSNLGSVSGAVNLNITTTQDGVSVIGTTGDSEKGHVYGGGDESFVSNATPAQASTTVTISGNTEIKGNVFGGGNRGDVSGSTTVNIQQ